MRVLFAAVLTLCLLAGAAPAATWYIQPDGNGDAPTIQAGIDSSAAGDTVLLASGTYTGPGNRNIVFRGVAVTVASETSDPADCILDCEGLGQGFYVANADRGVTLDGLTVTNGNAFFGGGALLHSNTIVRRCVFRGCTAQCGGGVSVWSNATLDRCSLLGNTASVGAGAHVSNSFGQAATFLGCTISGNFCGGLGGGFMADGAATVLRDCVIADNTARSGGALAATLFCYAVLTNCTLTGNSAFLGPQAAAGLYIDSDDNTVSLSHCIISFSGQGRAVVNESSNKSGAVCTNIYGNPDGDWTSDWGSPGVSGNFSADPLYCDATAGVFTLQTDSPCAPPGASGCGLVGALPVDCGPVSLTPVSWGRLKTRYR